MATMADGNEGTPSIEGQAPAAEATTVAEASGTAPAADEVTTLRSRNAGLDAKVTELQRKAQAAEAAAAAAAQKLADYESGKVQADEALRAQLSEKEQELARERAERRIERITAKYPETFGVLGDAALGLSEDQLAASEARFAGVPETSAPAPVGNNAPRVPAGTKSIEDMNIAELEAHLKAMPRSVMGLSD